jgi:hypothetical protein
MSPAGGQSDTTLSQLTMLGDLEANHDTSSVESSDLSNERGHVPEEAFAMRSIQGAVAEIPSVQP